jgi:hypothetical protein
VFDPDALHRPWFAVEFLLGLVVVAVLAGEWFNRPGSIRRQTTAAKYHAGLLVYRFGLALVYCSAALALAAHVPPTVVVVAMIALRKAPLVWHFDVWTRRGLHWLVGVRTEAARLVDTLVRAELLAPVAEREVALVLHLHGYDPHEETIPAAEPMRRLWLKAAVVFHQIRGWADDPGYRRFVVEAATEFDVLRQRFDQLSMKVVRVSETVDRLALWSTSSSAASSADDDRTAREIITRLYTDLREDVAFFWRNTCLFVAHEVLAVSATAGGRRRRLERIGFVLPPTNRPTSRVLGWAFVTYVAIFVAFRVMPLLLDGSHESRAPIWSGLVRAVMIATVQVVAIMVAILPKFRFGFANEDLHGRVPLAFVLGAGLVAAAVAVPIQLWFNLLIYPSPIRALESLAISYPWLLMPFVTAATFAYLVQDSRWSTLASRTRRRLADGLVFTAATVSATLATHWMLQHVEASSARSLAPRIAIAVAIGLAIGAMVPAECRRRYLDVRPTRRPVRETTAPSGPLAAVRP